MPAKCKDGKKVTLTKAVATLVDSKLGYDASLRIPFQAPTGIYAEHVYVEANCALHRGKGSPTRNALAKKVGDQAACLLSKHFSARDKNCAKLHLKIFVCDVSSGDREARVFAAEAGVGQVRCCLAWVLCSKDGLLVLDGGRLGLVDNLMYGVLDFFNIQTGEACLLHKIIPRLCKQIQTRIDIPSVLNYFEKFFMSLEGDEMKESSYKGSQKVDPEMQKVAPELQKFEPEDRKAEPEVENETMLDFRNEVEDDDRDEICSC